MDIDNPEIVERIFRELKVLTSAPPSQIKLLSWNLDGLDFEFLKKRTDAVIKIIETIKPDVVFFQEVVPPTAGHIENNLKEYRVIQGRENRKTFYFTMTLLRISTFHYDGHKITKFENSVMGRSLLEVEARSGTNKYVFLNTHLESMKDFSEERMSQLIDGFRRGRSYPKEVTIIFGGDLNLRDYEERTPPGFVDLWQKCGSQKEFKFTWDAKTNTNIDIDGPSLPRLRFDRLYFRSATPESIIPVEFNLVGKEKVALTGLYPSDHYGILVSFKNAQT